MINLESDEINKYIEKYLRDYQAEAVENIINIYNREQHNRFASVVLPTGAGKSFIAMALLQMINNQDFIADGYDVNAQRNNSRMLYVAPTKDILLQIKLHIIKNIYIPNIKNVDGINLENMSLDEINNIVSRLFPNLMLKCYAGVKGLIDENDSDILTEQDVENAELIILDEAHRSGAKEWSQKIENVIGKNNSKILAISATPERNDKEGKEMMAGIARMVYPNEVVTPDDYMAQEIYILDAMRDGLINVPKVLSSNFYLYYSSEYKDVLQSWREETDFQTKEYLSSILDKMELKIGISSKEYENREIPDEIIKQARIDATNRLIKEELSLDDSFGKMNPNDKAIVFIPNRESSEDDLTEFFEQYIEEIKQYYDGVIDPKTGKQIEVIPHIISSEYSEDENSNNLSEFENASENSSGIHILITQNKGAEGLHIDGGKIVYDLRGGDKTNVALQRVGRVISSIDPEKPLCKHNKTRFFDIKGSLFKQAVKGIGRKNSIQYDIYRLKQISEWITKNGRYPDINAGIDVLTDNIDLKQQAEAEKEARMAYAIKQYQKLVTKYRQGYEIEPGQESKVNELLELVDKMPQFGDVSFMNVQIAERTKPPYESDLVGKDFLFTTPDQDKFMQLHIEAMQLGKENLIPNKSRIDKVMHILQVISMFKPDLSLPGGIITRESVYERWNGGYKTREIQSAVKGVSLDLKDFLKSNFYENEIKEIMVLLKSADTKQLAYFGEEYDFGKELAYARGLFFTAENSYGDVNHSPFESYNIDVIINSGLIDFKRCPELYSDIKKMFGLEQEEYLDYIGTEKVTFKKEQDINKLKRNNEQRYNERDESKRNPPYSNKKFGVLDRFSGVSLVTGKRVMTVKELERQKEQQKNKREQQRRSQEERKLEERFRQRELEKQREEEKAREERKKRIEERKKQREERRKLKRQAIAENPTKYFRKTKYGYVYHHELTFSSKGEKKTLFNFDEECDEQGMILEEDPDTGNQEYHLLKDIEITRLVMTQMIDFGKTFEEVCQTYMKCEEIDDIEIAKDDIGFFISNTIALYLKIPTILEPQLQLDKDSGELKLSFSGVDELLNSRDDIKKQEHIKNFLDTVKDLTGIDFIEIRRKVLEEDIDTIRGLRGKAKDKEKLSAEQSDALYDATKRKEEASYLDEYR